MAAPAPGVSGALSIIPGLGQTANGNALEGLGWFFSSAGLFFSGNRYASQVGFDLWMYNMYDAYRDAGAKDTSKQNVFQNWIAPFNPLNLIDPIAPPVLTLYAFAKNTKNSVQGPHNKIFTLPFFTAVGAGEEGLFRGFLYPGFSHVFGSKLIGATVSSIAFSAFHLINQTSYDSSPNVLLGRFIMGMVLCLQTSINKYDLRKSIFTHAWIDTIVDWKSGANGIGHQAIIPEKFPPLKLNVEFKF
jgi:membrane protease YdiL (CAAX protease family)